MDNFVVEILCAGWNQGMIHHICRENASNISVGTGTFFEQMQMCGSCETKLREWEYEDSGGNTNEEGDYEDSGGNTHEQGESYQNSGEHTHEEWEYEDSGGNTYEKGEYEDSGGKTHENPPNKMPVEASEKEMYLLSFD